MDLNRLMNYINKNLAGEQFDYTEMKVFLDRALNDVNAKLSACFPRFSDFTSDTYAQYPDYNFIPDEYLIDVVALGTAVHFYSADEEGIQAARDYAMTYQQNLFRMERDFMMLVPEIYQLSDRGYFTEAVTSSDPYVDANKIFDFN